MKKEIKKGLLIVTIMGTMLSHASKPSAFEVNNEIKKTMVVINNVKEGQVLVIKDYFGVVLYKEFIEKTGAYTKGFDLTALPDGNYFFELDKDLEIQMIPFKVKANTVEFYKEKETKFFKPVLRFKENKILFSRLSLDYKPLTIKIYYGDSNGSSNYELIHTDKFQDTKVIERVYALDKEKKGKYRIVVETEGHEFIKTTTL
ncbi:hypothetical protein OE09_0110 [Flavobacteriaceae bacterium MAR_2010_72]|nr:hypothetical protein OE09_0110 [Flavobacteriaceae bacterium MAR_2010_72]TVZ58186.1 hypothetical protein NA63_0682 [Flavobacteriaceae bacterium MAR_2010_105]